MLVHPMRLEISSLSEITGHAAYILFPNQSVELLCGARSRSAPRRETVDGKRWDDVLTPHRLATVWNSFPTPYTSSSLRLSTLAEDNSSSKPCSLSHNQHLPLRSGTSPRRLTPAMSSISLSLSLSKNDRLASSSLTEKCSPEADLPN